MDISVQKQNGVVFTPQWVADFMVSEILKNQKIQRYIESQSYSLLG